MVFYYFNTKSRNHNPGGKKTCVHEYLRACGQNVLVALGISRHVANSYAKVPSKRQILMPAATGRGWAPHAQLCALPRPLIWSRSSRPPRCPSGRRRRKSSCEEHLSETAPVEHMQTNHIWHHRHRTAWVTKCFDWRRRTRSLLWRRRLMDEGQREEQRAICQLQPVSSCREMARQAGYTPPPCGFKACPAMAFTPTPHTKTTPHPTRCNDITLPERYWHLALTKGCCTGW